VAQGTLRLEEALARIGVCTKRKARMNGRRAGNGHEKSSNANPHIIPLKKP
jgi:hypothetical protein